MNAEIAISWLRDMQREFSNQRRLAERAMSQLDERDLFRALDSEGNSVAVIMKHVGGNLRSRWTDFLNSDGEKPDRNRDAEFVSDHDTVSSIAGVWEQGWSAVDATLSSLTAEDLAGEVRIRGEAVPVVQALNRSLAHTAQHVGQIIFLARHLKGTDWTTLSIPRGKSSEFLPRPTK